MDHNLTTKRVATIRRVGWLSVASMLALALLAPTANAASVTPTDPGTGNPTCADLNPAWTLSFKIDTGALENKTYTAADAIVATNWAGQEITLSGVSGAGQTFNWSSTKAVSGVLVKAGNDNHALYTYNPAVTSDTGLTHGASQQGISHLLFCGGTVTTTTTSSSSTTTSSTTTSSTTTSSSTTSSTTTASTTTASTTTASTTTASTTTVSTTTAATTPSQAVLSETGTPSVTLPPTDALNGSSTPSSDSWRLFLVAMAALLASVLVMTPAKAASRRR